MRGNRRFTAMDAVTWGRVLVLVCLAIGFLCAPPAGVAATLTVTNTLDDGSGGCFRSVLASATGADTIRFTGGLTGTITLGSRLPAITQNTVIDGTGATITISAGTNGPAFFVTNGAPLTITNLTLGSSTATGGRGGDGNAGGGGGLGAGAAIFVDFASTVTLTGVTLSSNKAVGGAGGNVSAVLIVGGGGGGGLNGGAGGAFGLPGGNTGVGGTGGQGGAGAASGGGGGGATGGLAGPVVVGATAGADGTRFAGGGGGGTDGLIGASGGNGVYGGGGGGAGTSNFALPGGTSDFGGGSGGSTPALSLVGKPGNGGSAFGGAIFVANGGTLNFTDTSFSGNSVTAGAAGTGGVGGATGGSALGSDLFIDTPGAATATVTAGTLTYSGTIAGAGTLTKAGAGVLVLTGINPLAGASTISAGTLEVNGSTAFSASTVNSGATLAGSGTVGAVTVNSGGFVAPGSSGSVGTLAVSGVYTQAAGSTLKIRATPVTADKVSAAGTATVAGTVVVTPQAGTYAASTKYTIVTATGGITNNFSGVTVNNAPTLIAALSNDANNVFVTLMTASSVLSSLVTVPNSVALVDSLITANSSGQLTGPLATVFSKLLTLGSAQAEKQVQSMSNELHAEAVTESLSSNSQAGIRLFDQLRGEVTNTELTDAGAVGGSAIPGRPARAGAAGGRDAVAVFAPPSSDLESGAGGPGPMRLNAPPVSGMLAPGPLSLQSLMGAPALSGHASEARKSGDVWATAFATFVQQSSAPGVFGSDSNGGGLLAGRTWHGKGRLSLGLEAGYSETNVHQRSSSNTLNLHGPRIGAYALVDRHPCYILADTSVTFNSNNSQRFVAAGGATGAPAGSYNERIWTTRLEVGRRSVHRNTVVQPSLALSYSSLTDDAYTETGGGAFNLTVSGQTVSSFVSMLGAEVTRRDVPGHPHRASPRLGARWLHELGSTSRTVTSQFVGTTTPFTLSALSADSDRFQAVAGLTFHGSKSTDVDALINAEFGSNQQTQVGLVRVTHRF